VHVVLVGFMGAGKTATGRELAALLGFEFRDLDEQVERRACASIPDLIRTHGEAAFRAVEAQCLAEALEERLPIVLATGGGAPLNDDSWSLMRERARTVALTASDETVLFRAGDPAQRPLLQPDPARRIEQLQRERRARYLEADLIIATDEIAPSEVARRIKEWLERE
jgi:shikimate kinase